MDDIPEYTVQAKVNGEWIDMAEFTIDDFDHADPMRAFAEHATVPVRIISEYGGE